MKYLRDLKDLTIHDVKPISLRQAEASEVPAEAGVEAGGKGGGFVVAMLGPRATLDGYLVHKKTHPPSTLQ